MGATDLCHPIATLTRHLCLWVWFKLCVINACCVFVCICYESNVCVWPCCSPDPLLVSVHITQFSANWIIYDDSSYIALYLLNTIYCFIALDHQFIMCTNQLLSYFHLISANWITIRYCFQGLYIRISNAVHFYFHIFNSNQSV